MIIRVTDTAVDPEDVERAQELLHSVVRPACERIDGCQGIEVHVRIDEHHGSLVEVAVVSRWASRETMDAAMRSESYADAMGEMRALFQHSPIVRIFETTA